MTLTRNVNAISNVTSNYHLVDLAHTLNLRRTLFSHRAFTVAYEGHAAEAFMANLLQTGITFSSAVNIGYLFTGQGVCFQCLQRQIGFGLTALQAQWIGMGRAAPRKFPNFMDTIQRLDSILARILPKPSFTVTEMLLADNQSAGNRINEAEVSQPLCTAIQIAIVDLFCQWDVMPTVSIGHSSGEIGAAYAAGLISAPEAIMTAFCRGRAVAQNSTLGSMLAMGLGAKDVQEFLPASAEDVCIACENSPNSVTLSGTAKFIYKLRDDLNSKGIFIRELKTGKAYHSPHMASIGAEYDVMLSEALGKMTEDDLLWCQPRSHMISSVTGELIAGDRLPQGYWSANLQQRVLFNTAIQRLGVMSQFEHVNLVVEIGPHSALSGPFKQICKDSSLRNITYVPSLVRNKNDCAQLLSVAGSLFLAGYPVDLEVVNVAAFLDTEIRKPTARNLLVDLPPYQWNYEKTYWAEPRGSAE